MIGSREVKYIYIAAWIHLLPYKPESFYKIK